MGTRDYLGEFELVVLLALARLPAGAYGASIHREIHEATGRDVSIPAVYVTLKRMERKGLVTSSMGEGDGATRRPVRQYQIEETGRAAVERSREQLERLWSDLRRPLSDRSGS